MSDPKIALAGHRFFSGIDPAIVETLAECAREVSFAAGEYLVREGEPADRFFLLEYGTVALELHRPGRDPLVLETIHEGEVVGTSWVVPPYRWSADARALDLVRAIAIDVRCLRGKSDSDPKLGYELLKRFLPLFVQRLEAVRLQLLDVYGKSPD
ncbi:CRP-like cAMP-activated global transcriptional regulator [Methylacidimicrobium cyclopophantes]|uniref:CRP-like cAMP-activated global transcriptional regulator n=1 Tax=Methylacidimicrobium cyclopophantes TaxID=1041766 RepID=A0A5E6MBI5_9BACT|nr:cyclic nucleotide-binding domain-containing protein [Methylacidimicrobium cyclopophantes]VVM06912.1 CRP-like cAMP-activated global transcriptional regulator [Methylacidimicrobium cyclopophantes]